MKKFLEKFDGVWALPIAFIIFVYSGYLLQSFGGFGTGTYDIAFIQPLFLATAVVIGIFNASVWGLYFTFRDLHKWIYGQEGRLGFKGLSPLVKTVFSLTVFFLFILCILLIYIHLI